MTYIAARDLYASNGTTYEDWEAGVKRVFFDVTGIQANREGIALDDFGLNDLRDWYESGYSARETVYRILENNGLAIEAEIDEWVDRQLSGRERALGVG